MRIYKKRKQKMNKTSREIELLNVKEFFFFKTKEKMALLQVHWRVALHAMLKRENRSQRHVVGVQGTP